MKKLPIMTTYYDGGGYVVNRLPSGWYARTTSSVWYERYKKQESIWANFYNNGIIQTVMTWRGRDNTMRAYKFNTTSDVIAISIEKTKYQCYIKIYNGSTVSFTEINKNYKTTIRFYKSIMIYFKYSDGKRMYFKSWYANGMPHIEYQTLRAKMLYRKEYNKHGMLVIK